MASQRAPFLALLPSLPIIVDAVVADGTWEAVMDPARSRQLSSYDACYLELARRWALCRWPPQMAASETLPEGQRNGRSRALASLVWHLQEAGTP